MSKYKKETTNIKNASQGWTKNDYLRSKYYRKNNWMIEKLDNTIWYFIIDESYEGGYYFDNNKREFLEEKHMLKIRNTPVWKAMHGEYDDE